MKITITGSLGNISKPLTNELVQKGHTVTVISSKPEKQKDIEASGAIAALGSVEDVNFLKATFKGAEAIYTMIPPNYYQDKSLDMRTFYNKIANNYAKAIEQSEVKRVVHLSSIGAHTDKGNGQLAAHYEVAAILNKLEGVDITFMRPLAFYYNLKSFIPVIKNTGTISANYGSSDKIAWVSPLDIATAIAEEIVTPLTGRKIVYVASDELTCNEVATILGDAIGKPDLKWNLISDEAMQNRLEKVGMTANYAAGLVGMNAAMHSGILFEDYYKNKPVLSKTKMVDFAKEFAAAYNN
jgi:uncharacterized protein YbjT (DUF2867 family)